MEGFTLAMALMDAIPVLCFGASMLLLAVRFASPLFLVGACISTAAGCGKVLWKGILGVTGKNIRWLNRYFLPVQFTGFALILLSFLLNFGKISLQNLGKTILCFPAAIFYALRLLGMLAMIWYKKRRFDNTPKSNWTAQTINTVAQISLLAALLMG